MNRWIAATFDEFGRGLGIEGLAPDARGRLSMRLGAERTLELRAADDAVVVLLAAPPSHGDALAERSRALGLCHLRHGWPMPVRAGRTREGGLVFLVRIPARQFLVPTLEQAIELLGRLLDRARG
jgi:type III secretion system chaperone SycN